MDYKPRFYDYMKFGHGRGGASQKRLKAVNEKTREKNLELLRKCESLGIIVSEETKKKYRLV